jgi:hypothetical protein
VTEIQATITSAVYVPTHFDEVIDTAGCAVDEQLERLQRQFAAASRAAERARIEVDLLEMRDDVPVNVLRQARRQQAAAETRSARLQRALDTLESRTENA